MAALAVWGAAEVATGAFGLSDQLLRIVIIASVALFPVVLVGAWLFDVSIDWSTSLGKALIGVFGAVVGVLGALAWVVASGLTGSEIAPLDSSLQYRLALPEHADLGQGTPPRIAVSRDGRQMLYRGGIQGQLPMLWHLARNELEPRPLVGTEDAVNPVFSPDGTRFAFSRSVRVLGGQELVVAPLDAVGDLRVLSDSIVGLDGLTWGDDGYLYYDGITGGTDRGLLRISAEGGVVEQVTTVDTLNGESDHVWPHALPDGRGVLFTVVRSGDLSDADIAVSDPSGLHRIIGRGVASAYASTGHVLFVTRDGELIARRFDLDPLVAEGPGYTLADGVNVRLNGRTDLSLSRNGRLVYTAGEASAAGAELVWVDLDGSIEVLDDGVIGNHWGFVISPDGSRLAFSVSPVTNQGGDTEVWVKPLAGGPATQITTYRGGNRVSSWAPDGRSVLFATDRLGSLDLFTKRADGLGSAEPALAGAPLYRRGVYSPDGEWLLYEVTGSGTPGLWAVRPASDMAPVAVDLQGARAGGLGRVSPNGRWLALSETRTGDPRDGEIVVRSFPDVERFRLTVSDEGGAAPMWSPDGRTLYYRAQRRMIAVDVESDGEFRERGRRVLFRLHPTILPNPQLMGLMPDGQRFIMARSGTAIGGKEIIVVEGLFDMLSRLDPS